MARRQRDYKAEYAARKERAAFRGLSTSEGRGHARVSKGEIPLSIRKAIRRVMDGGAPTTKEQAQFRALEVSDREKIFQSARRGGMLYSGPQVHEFWSNMLGS